MKLNNPEMRVIMESDGARFQITKVTRSIDEANTLCALNEGYAVIASDNDGNHYVAECVELTQKVTKSRRAKK